MVSLARISGCLATSWARAKKVGSIWVTAGSGGGGGGGTGGWSCLCLQYLHVSCLANHTRLVRVWFTSVAVCAGSGFWLRACKILFFKSVLKLNKNITTVIFEGLFCVVRVKIVC